MVIYEVHLATRHTLRHAFLPWLEEHMREMVQFDGFRTAHWTQPLPEFLPAEFSPDLIPTRSHEECWIVQYEVDSKEQLLDYLQNHAPRMRGDGPARFGSDLRVVGRRVLTVGKKFSAKDRQTN